MHFAGFLEYLVIFTASTFLYICKYKCVIKTLFIIYDGMGLKIIVNVNMFNAKISSENGTLCRKIQIVF